jgi:hypothetical protein
MDEGREPRAPAADDDRRLPPGRSDHLDEDAEAMEDPVHAGDARHQHERHERERSEQG